MKRSVSGWTFFTLGSAVFCASSVVAQDAAFSPARAESLLAEYCSDCHNSQDWAGSVAFDLLDVATVSKETAVWEHAVRKLRGRLMPPPGNEQPSQADIDLMIAFLEGSLDANAARPQAGHVPVQRLNRNEYAQVVKDLLAVDIDTLILRASLRVSRLANQCRNKPSPSTARQAPRRTATRKACHSARAAVCR